MRDKLIYILKVARHWTVEQTADLLMAELCIADHQPGMMLTPKDPNDTYVKPDEWIQEMGCFRCRL